MPSQLFTIARNTFIESVRQPIYFILIALCGLMVMLTTWSAAFTLGMTESGEVSGDNKMLLDVSMATVFVCGMLLAAFLATAVISKEIENKTVLTVVSKPVPRPLVVLGKYLGVSAAILGAVLTMLLFIQMALRHEVMSTASDKLDGPVLLFSFAAVGIALAIAVWCNFFYGWVFTQTASLLLLPLMLLAWLLVLLINKKWHVQPIATDFKTQVALCSACVGMSMLVLTAIATAASARLGQVMTLVVCCGVFVLGLVSNRYLGRRAIENDFTARVSATAPVSVGSAGLLSNGDAYDVTVELEPRVRIPLGSAFYYGPYPSGMLLATPPYPSYTGDLNDRTAMADRSRIPALVVTRIDGKKITVQHIGADGPAAARPPARGDYIFLRQTRYNGFALVAWGITPNVQYYWLLDAVTQNQRIPPAHVGLVALYALAQVGVFLSLAVVLFQRREVG